MSRTKSNTCRRCSVALVAGNSYPSRQCSRDNICKPCTNAKNREYRSKNREKVRASFRRYHAGLRKEVLCAYGHCCACCGETTADFLTIDHIFNDGAAHKKERHKDGGGRQLYLWLKQHGFPKDRFQLLCANCNFSKGKYGSCPHTRFSLVKLMQGVA